MAASDRTSTGTVEGATGGRGASIGRETAGIGVLTGLLVAVLGYLLTYLLLSSRVTGILRRHAPEFSIARDVIPAHVDAMPVWKLVGWLFYNAHGGQVRFTVADTSGANLLNFVAYETGLAGWVWLLPAGLLAITAGLVVLAATDGGLRTGVLVGGALAAGYALLLVVALGGFAVEAGEVRMTLAPSPLAIVGFPLVAGVIGGGLTGALRRRRGGA